MIKYINAERLKAEIERRKGELMYGSCSALIQVETNCKNEAYNEILSFITSLQQEQSQVADASKMEPEVDLEKAARNVYESWMGGTMDDFLRDMAELLKALNTRKEE